MPDKKDLARINKERAETGGATLSEPEFRATANYLRERFGNAVPPESKPWNGNTDGFDDKRGDQQGVSLGALSPDPARLQMQTNQLNAVRKSLEQAPSELAHYAFKMSEDGKTLTANPERAGARTRGIHVERNKEGGFNIQFEGQKPFVKAEWKNASLESFIKERVKDPVKRADALRNLKDQGYDLKQDRPFLMVYGQGEALPTGLAFSKDAGRPGMISVCTEVADFNMSSGGPVPTLRKPVVYFYPPKPTELSVRIEIDGIFTAQYPKGENGAWRLIADPSGSLLNPRTERRYSYLFWEGRKAGAFDLDPARSHCVSGKDIEGFLEKAAARFALSDRERTDFVTYWLPHLEQNKHSVIQFLTEAEYERHARMEIIPKPDSVIRLFMIFRAAEAPVPTGNPELELRRREGFTVVEWGGCNLDESLGETVAFR